MLLRCNFLTRKKLWIFGLLYSLVSIQPCCAQSVPDTAQFAETLQTIHKQPTASQRKLERYLAFYAQTQDTTQLVRTRIGLANVLRYNGNYSDAYEQLWQALALAEKAANEKLQMHIHSDLATLYNFFNKLTEELKHRRISYHLCKKLIAQQQIHERNLGSHYFGFGVYFRQINAFDTALLYLDSCKQVAKTHKQAFNPYAATSEASIYLELKQFKAADSLISLALNHYTKHNITNYLVRAYTIKGRIYLLQKKYKQAEKYLKKSLEAVDLYKKHFNSKAQTLHLLAETYSYMGNDAEAYAQLKKANQLEKRLYSWSSANKKIFEIKNSYRDSLEARKLEVAQQQLVLHQKEQANLYLKIMVGGIFVCIGFILIFLRAQSKLKTYEQEREKARLKNELQAEQHSKILELKNKELTSYTLRLIEKEKELLSIKQYLQAHAADIAEKLMLKNTTDNSKLWEEFNQRFVQVNANFYAQLRQKFPELSPTEVKHCALIKLDFSAKEMAQLLGISPASVHLSRHRIRKKMGLSREENLVNFVAGI